MLRKKVIGISLDQNIIDKIAILAKEDFRNLSNYVNKLLLDFLEALEDEG